MKKFAVLGFLLSSIAFAAPAKTEVEKVYKIVNLTEASPNNWMALQTVTGSVVYVRCNTMQFDDAVRDRVAGFETEAACQEFLNIVRKHANIANPVEVQINSSLGLNIKISL
jgi:hypothetical protein